MKIALITDAWRPQVNGVVTTWTHVTGQLKAMGHEVLIVQPDLFRSIPCPGVPEIHLAVRPAPRLRHMLDEFGPEAVHIATEGPLGFAARRYVRRHDLPFTTSYHTQFPEYFKAYFGFPLAPTYRYLRWFHRGARATLVPTPSMKERLDRRGFENVAVWSRGVNRELFRPRSDRQAVLPGGRPVYLCAGRVSPEKNIAAFLEADLPGRKIVVGEGPVRRSLMKRFPDATFTGYLPPEEFAAHMAAADVLVFPSRTDTFGLVMIEAMACGTPVAAYPVTGPLDVVRPGVTGILADDLAAAARAALELDRDQCAAGVAELTWQRCAEQVLGRLARVSRVSEG